MGDRFDVLYVPLGAAAYGGAEKSLLELAAAVRKRGYRVGILAEEALEAVGFMEACREHCLPVYRAGWSPERHAVDVVRQAYGAFRRLRAGIVHFNISWRRHMWLVAVTAKLVSGAKIVGTMRAMPDPHDAIPRRRHIGFLPGLRLWHVPESVAGRIWAQTADVTVSINATDYPRRLRRHYGYEGCDLRVIHNGVDVEAIAAAAVERAALREKLGLGGRGLAAVYAGRLAPPKGVDLFLQAGARLDGRWRLVVVGEGPERPRLEALARELGIEERVVFTGGVPEARPFLAAADVVVVPSTWYEAFGRVVVEALAAGVPVVASRIGGMAELFEDGLHGMYVPPGDVDALHAALEKLGRDPDLRAAMGRAGRELAARRYSLGRVVDEYVALYKEMGIQDDDKNARMGAA